jgi:hypothetical protein
MSAVALFSLGTIHAQLREAPHHPHRLQIEAKRSGTSKASNICMYIWLVKAEKGHFTGRNNIVWSFWSVRST